MRHGSKLKHGLAGTDCLTISDETLPEVKTQLGVETRPGVETQPGVEMRDEDDIRSQ